MKKIVVVSPKANFADRQMVNELENRSAVFYEQAPVDLSKIRELYDADEKILMLDEILTAGGFKSLNEVAPKFKNVTHITNLSARYHEVDLPLLNKLGIKYSNNPDVTTESVAELAIMDMFALVRNLPLVQKGEVEFYGGRHLGREIKELSAGILGYGSIGGRIAVFCNAFGMPVKIWSRTPKPGAYPQVPISTLLTQDVIFISLAASEDTKSLFTNEFYSTLRDNQYVIDITGTDNLYDKNRLIRMANEKDLAGYAFEAEKDISVFAKLTGNVLITPHVGWGTRDSYKRLYGNWVRATLAAYDGSPLNIISAGE